ncbi:MAG: glycerophosphodiester phosphodiesterase [Promethearchaeota archaeon]
MIFIAHRGFRVGIPENSMRGFLLSAELGVDYVELDVHLTSDGKVVVVHDETLDRTTTGRGAVRTTDVAEFKKKWLLDPSSGAPTGEHPPTLGEVLRVVPGPVKFMVELKGAGVAGPALDVVRRSRASKRVTFSASKLKPLQQANEGLPGAPLCLNITSCREFSVKRLLKCSAPGDLPLPFGMISLRSTRVSRKFVAVCHEVGSLALAWDFLSPSRPLKLARKLVSRGIDGLLLDDPGAFRVLSGQQI